MTDKEQKRTPRTNASVARKLTAIGSVLAAIVAWGVYFPYAKIILAKLSPDVLLLFRLSIGSLILWSLTLTLRRPCTVRKQDLPVVIAAGAVGLILHQLLQLTGLKYTTANNTGWIITLIPPATGLLAWIFLKEKISFRQFLGMTIALVGVLLFITQGRLNRLSLVGNFGDFLGLTSIFTWSAYTIMTKTRLSRYDPLPLSAIHLTVGFLFFLLTSGGKTPAQAVNLTPADWLIVIAIGAFPSGLAYYWWNAGLKRLSSTNTSLLIFPQAIVISLTSYLVLGEKFTPSMLAFACLIILGVATAVSSSRASPPRKT